MAWWRWSLWLSHGMVVIAHLEETRQEEGLGRRGDWAGVGGKVEEDGGEEGEGRG